VTVNLGLNEEQEMLKKAAGDFLKVKCPPTLVRELEGSEKGYSPELWHEMAELGWLGMTFPKKYGGEGATFTEMAVLYEEMGWVALPSPHLSTVMMCGHVLLDCGSEEQKAEFLPRIANGDIILALALPEPEAGWYANSITTQATKDKDDYIINGTKLFVAYAHAADYLLCVAKTKIGDTREDGISLFIVDAKSDGLSLRLLKTMGGDKQCEVVFSNVRVPMQNLLGQSGIGQDQLMKALQPAIVMQSAEMVGGAQKVLEMTIDYAKQRVQFERPIGAFQVIQHKCADMAKGVEGARLIIWAASWKLSEGLPCAKDAAMAKFYTNAIYRRVAWEGHQVHAGVAFQKEHDMQFYSRRAMASEYRLGDKWFHQDTIAREMGLIKEDPSCT